MDSRTLGLDLSHRYAPWWLARLWALGAQTGLELVATRSQLGDHGRRRLRRWVGGEGRLAQIESRLGELAREVGETAAAAPARWLGGPQGLACAAGGHVLGMGDPGSAPAPAPAHTQALVRTVGLWAGRFDLRWLMLQVRTPQPSALQISADARVLERALERAWPQLAGKVAVQVGTGPDVVTCLELHASFAGAPGTQRLQSGLRDACAAAGWSRHVSLADPEFLPAHALDHAQVWVNPETSSGLGPLGTLRAWYDAPALEAARLLEFAARGGAPQPTSDSASP